MVQSERKRFVRTRVVQSKTPSRKSDAIIISTNTMSWDLARELIDSIGKIVPSDQIKNCNIVLEKQ